MTVGNHLPNHLGIGLSPAAVEEKRSADLFGAQRGKDHSGWSRVAACFECDR
jgi:hypothetical protein